MSKGWNLTMQLKTYGRQYPFLRKVWSDLRWYTSKKGSQSIITAFKHLGFKVQCPYCGWQGSSFYPNPEPHYRLNSLCPKCFSKERHRFLYLYLMQELKIQERSLRVLEIAPGPYSIQLFNQLPNIQYFTVDYESPLASCKGDIQNLPFSSSFFDLIICFHVLEHVPDDIASLKELRRLLHNQQGLLLVQVPIEREVTFEDPNVQDKETRLRLFGQEDHVRSYGKDIENRLLGSGFCVNIGHLRSSGFDKKIQRYGLQEDDFFYLCTPA